MFPHYTVARLLSFFNLLGLSYQQQQLFYKKMFANKPISDTNYSGIEKKYHLVWITNPEHPKEIKTEWLSIIDNNLAKLTNTAGFELYLWSNCPSCIPESAAAYGEHGFKIRSIFEPGISIHQGLVDEAVHDNNFGIASDYIRYKVLQKEGGFYTDFNYQFVEGLGAYIQNYSFVAPEFRLGYLLDNHVIAAKKGSVILQDTTEMIEHLHNNFNIVASMYNTSTINPEEKTVLKTIAPYVISIMKNIADDAEGVFILPIDTKAPNPDIAKPSINKLSLRDGDPTNTECADDFKDFYLLFDNYLSNSICIADMVGYDYKNSKSWLSGAPLWHDE